MKGSDEAWLMLLAAALYLGDSFWLLASNEAVLFRGWRGRWQAGFGAMRWRLGAREPYLPNPFLPHRPQFRLAWRVDGVEPRQKSTLPLQVPPELARFAPFVWGAGVALFVLLPLGMFANLGTGFTMAAIVLLYAINSAALLQLWWLRGRLKLSNPQASQIVFECLVCPPFAVNLVRRLCAKLRHDEDFVAAAARLLRPADLAVAHAECLMRVDEQIECEPESSTRLTALQVARARFVPLRADEHE
ncbi:MAG: hypothetical protein ABI433_06425 [Burkholderiaceae bacterium]